MDLSFPPVRIRVFHGRVQQRLLTGIVAAALLVVVVPAPAMAAPTPTVTISDATVAEGTGASTTASFTIQVAPPPRACCALQVGWSTAPGSANAPGDFTASSGTVTLSKAATSRVVTVPIVGDSTDESNETFVVNLTTLVGSPGQIGDAQGVGTITDNDAPPTLSVNDVSVTEGNAGTTTATFTVSTSAASGFALTFDWATAAGTATAGTDFVSATGSRTIAAGATSTTIAVTVNGDSVSEANETFTVTLSNPVNATIADGSGQGTIVDDDPLPTLSVNNASVTEGNTGTTTATFTVSLSVASGKTVTFDWATTAGTATPGTDFVSANGSRTISAGTTSAAIAITVNGDVLNEANETFSVNLSNLTNATIADGSGLGTITNDDPLPTLAVNDVTVTETNGGTFATFTVSLSAVSGNAVTFDWATAAGTAAAGTDFNTASGSRTISPGTTSASIAIAVNDDVADEFSETFTVTLSNPANVTIADGSGTGTINDDDAAPDLSIADVSLAEGNTGTTTATFTVSLSAVSGKTVTFDWATAAGTATAGTDFVSATGSRTIAAGATSAAIAITVNGDPMSEANETFTVTLSNPANATIADGSGTGTINDDDPLPALSVNDVSLPAEGNAGTTTATFTASLSAVSGRTVTVNWSTADADATQPVDYTAGSGTLTLVPGDTSETFAVTVNGDLVAELDEAFRVTLSGPSNATLGDADGIGTIVDDEGLPVVDIDEPSIVEGQSGTSSINFNVILSHPSDLTPVTVDWTTTPGTAAAGSDYVAASGQVTFAPMDVSETVSIIVNGDVTFEGDETFALDLSNATVPTPIGHAQGIATIDNDDTAPIASLANVSKAEGNAGTSLLTFVVSLSGNSDVDADFDWATADGTASAVADYVAGSGTLTISAGATTGTVSVLVNGDVAYESNETLSLLLSNPVGATIGDGVAQGTITNDDKAPTAITLGVVRKPRAVIAKGILEPASPGQRVTVTLFRKKGGTFVKVSAKTVLVRYLKDRDGDGKTDGSYTATLVRPKAKGSYKVLAQFKGTANYKPCLRAKVFTLTAS
jgi:Calx-beta domain-containing protein